MEKIDISNKNKASLLASLHNHTKAIGLGVLHDAGRDMTIEEAQKIIDEHEHDEMYVDYLWGRPLKVKLSDDEIRTDLYDRDAGEGMCLVAVNKAENK